MASTNSRQSAAGGLTCTVGDLLKYARVQLGEPTESGLELLTAASRVAMRSAQVPTLGNADAVGIAWHLRNAAGKHVVEHTGGTNGQTSSLQLVPEDDFALVVLTNADLGRQLIRGISRAALELYLGVSEPEPPEFEMTPHDLATYVGRYEAGMGFLELTIEQDRLLTHFTSKGGFPTRGSPPEPAPPPMRLRFYAADRFVVIDPPSSDACAGLLKIAPAACRAR